MRAQATPSVILAPAGLLNAFQYSTNWDRPAMTERDEPIAQLATRIPKDLHRRLKLYCVTHEIAVQDFVIQAIQEKLGRKTRPKKGTA